METGSSNRAWLFMASIYEKLAKSGWLGTKAQVSEQYGQPAWKTDDEPAPDDYKAKALKRMANKSASTAETDSSGS